MPIFGRRARHSPYMGSVVTARPPIHINARWRRPGFPARARRGASIPPVPSRPHVAALRARGSRASTGNPRAALPSRAAPPRRGSLTLRPL